MKKLFFAVTMISMTLFFSKAHAAIKIHPLCQQGFHQDSVGLGLEGGFTGQNLLPAQHGDQVCYDFGVSQAQEELQSNDQTCVSHFNDGKAQGLVEGGNSETSKCFSYGYMAGLASLHVSVREGQPGESPRGQECLAAYNTGYADSARHAQQNSGNENLKSDCYLTGFYDQQQLN